MNWKKNIQQIIQVIYCYLAVIWLTGIEKESSDGNGLDLVSPHTGFFYNMMHWDGFFKGFLWNLWFRFGIVFNSVRVFFDTFDLGWSVGIH